MFVASNLASTVIFEAHYAKLAAEWPFRTFSVIEAKHAVVF